MSLTTTEAIQSAMDDIKNAVLCLLDANEIECSGEKEELEYVYRRLEGKLGDAAAKEVSEMKREREEEE